MLFESDKVRALLAYLAVESERAHRRGKLVGLLWAERPERTGRQDLSQALSNLRHAIGDRHTTPPCLIITPQTLRFNRSSDQVVDVTAFTDLLAACEKHNHELLPACDQCLDSLRQALALCRRPFLESEGPIGHP